MIKPGFDAIAPIYDFLSALVFGPKLRQAQKIYLAQIPPTATILILGGGTGWLLKEICLKVPASRIVYVEASSKMLQLSKKRIAGLASAAPVEFRLGTEKNIEPTEKFEVIITPFVLDLFPPAELNNMCRVLYNCLQPGGQWLITDFVKPASNGIWSPGQKILLKSMYTFFRLVSRIRAATLPDWEKSLLHFDLYPQKSTYFYRGMIKSVLYQKAKL